MQGIAEVELSDRREARWLIESVAGALTPLAGAPTDAHRTLVHELICRRRAGEPLQYVIGSWQFRKLELVVDRRVLIPRPETEQVVEVALGHLRRLAEMTTQASWSVSALKAVDLGTGSGAIALSIAAEWPCSPGRSPGPAGGPPGSSSPVVDVEVWAVDRSADALEVAAANIERLGEPFSSRVGLRQGDWWQGLPGHLEGKISLAVSNPPYISSAEMAEVDPVVKNWEPREALEAGPAGTEAHWAILRDAPRWLRPGGIVVLEIAPHQAEKVAEMSSRVGLVQVEVHPDLAGRPRTVVARAR
ncbi:MAG: peptide chain release factor N(5)-glutamine methyltransferase [Acidimicrobiales bacterium]